MLGSIKSTLLASLALAFTTQACLEVRGYGSTGLGVRTNLVFVDNGNTVIDGGVDAAQGTINGIKGYSVDFDWNETAGPIHVTYKTPHGEFAFDVNNNGCSWSNCCGGEFLVLLADKRAFLMKS